MLLPAGLASDLSICIGLAVSMSLAMIALNRGMCN